MKVVLTIGLLLVLSGAALAQVPPMIEGTFIQDHAQVLTPDQRTALNQKVHQLDSKHIQLGVMLVQTTNGRDIGEYALDVGRTYGIGAKDGEHRGLLLTLAIADHKSNIQVSRHLETYITDGQTGEVLRGIRPQLRANDYNGAVNSAVDQLIALSAKVPESEAQGIVADQPKPEGVSEWWLLLLLLPIGVVAATIVSIRRRRSEAKSEWQPTTPPPAAPIYAPVYTASPKVQPQAQPAPKPATPEYVYVPAPTVYEPPSYSPSSSDSSSSYDSGGSFGGSSDFGGGGSSGDW